MKMIVHCSKEKEEIISQKKLWNASKSARRSTKKKAMIMKKAGLARKIVDLVNNNYKEHGD